MKVFRLKFITAVLVGLLANAQMLLAQDQPGENRAEEPLATTVQKQQLEIDALRAELKELKALLEKDLAKREPAQAGSSEKKEGVTTETASAVSQNAASQNSDKESKAGTSVAESGEKRLGDVERLLHRFRWSGDIRVRGESFLQDTVAGRHRARLRVRAGFLGKANEEFSGGVFLASGSIGDDPVSTNQTLTGFFGRKTFGLDRGWITYQPKKFPWMQLTGGKWAYTWLRTGLTLDVDLNPEGFSQKFSFDTKHPVVKNFSLTGMQLVFNETAGGRDSFAVGGQTSGVFQLGSRVKTTVAGTVLNWQHADAIARAVAATTLNANRNSNATVGSLTAGTLRYASQFLYADLLVDTQWKTPWERWPVRLTLDYVANPRAVDDQNDGFLGEIAVGRQQAINDLQFGYSFARVERDAVIAAFNESDMRAQTNVVQNKVTAMWLVRPNATASFTGWFGRTLDRRLQNAVLPPGLAPTEKDPWVTRLQWDMIYRF